MRRFSGAATQAVLLAPLTLLFISHIRYTKFVEGRPFRRLLPFALLLWAGTWAMEAGGVWGGLYHYEKTYFGMLRLGPVPVLIPSIWLLMCLLAASIVHFLRGPDGGRSQGRPLFWEALTSGWVLVSIGFAVEWHSSRMVGLWSWAAGRGRITVDGVPIINFLVWFAVGFLAPFLARAGRSPRIVVGADDAFLQALPAAGFGLVLAVNTGVYFARGYPRAGFLCGFSFLIFAVAALRRLVRDAKSTSAARASSLPAPPED